MQRSSPPRHNHRRASLRGSGGARTVLLRMAADQERAERIRALKQERPDLTWRRIADYVGVTERSATDWQRKGGIEYDNAKKLAELFEVDIDYIWRGTESDTPSPFAGQDELADRLDRIETSLSQARQELTDAHQEREHLLALLEKQNGLLTRQSRILDRIETAIADEEEAAKRLGDAEDETVERIARLALAEYRRGPGTPAPKRKLRAKSRTRQG